MTQVPEKPQEVMEYRNKDGGWGDVLTYPLACAGALIGAGVGAGICYMAARSGFYMVIIVGVLAGLGATLLSRRANAGIGILAALVAIVVSLWTEWFIFPFVLDDSLPYFIRHIGGLAPFKLLMHAAGAVAAAVIGAVRK